MKTLMGVTLLGLASFATEMRAATAFDPNANQSVQELIDQCSRLEAASDEQLQCFKLLSKAIEEQENNSSDDQAQIVQSSFEALRSVAQHSDDETGLRIFGDACEITVFYYGNFYRVSRRNVSVIDVYYAQFDASKLLLDQVSPVAGASYSRVKGVMENGAAAITAGGAELGSDVFGFAPKAASQSMNEYANLVVKAVPPQQDQTFEFVLVHPKKADAAADVMAAFSEFVQACQ